MTETTYTYRIRISDVESVNIEKRDPKDNELGNPYWRIHFDESQKSKINTLAAKAAYRPSTGEAVIDEDEIIELGTALYNVLFENGRQNDLLLFYDEVVHKKDAQLRIELDIDEEKLPYISSLPWEFLHIPSNPITGDLWLATSPDVIFSRRRSRWLAPEPIQLAPGEKLRITVVVSAPNDAGLGAVDYKKLYAELQVLASELGDQVDLTLLDPEQQPATRETIDRALEQEPHVFHFIGHGRFVKKDDGDVGEIAVMRETGRARWVNAAKFSNLFTRHRPSIVLLQACEGGQLSSSTAFAGVASQIVQQNIPVVMAMQYEVSNATARRFAREFYTRLANREPVDKSAQEGRNAISDWHETRDFATPVLFMRVRNGRLFAQEDRAEAQIVAQDEQVVQDIPPAPATLTLPQVASLGRQISQNFNADELIGLCLELGIDYEDLRGSSKASKARELADYCRRQGLVPQLWQKLYEHKDHVKWQV